MAFLPIETSFGGANHLRVYIGEVTLASGTGTLAVPLSTTYAVVATQKDATAVADGVSWSVSGHTVTLDSSNASSGEVYTLMCIGI